MYKEPRPARDTRTHLRAVAFPSVVVGHAHACEKGMRARARERERERESCMGPRVYPVLPDPAEQNDLNDIANRVAA